MTVYSLDLADKQELAFLAELMADVHVAAPDARFLLVGAMARDLLLYHAHGIRAVRATSDVDLALAVTDWEEFGTLRSALLSSGSFKSHPKVNHKVFHRERLEIDLIPFGGVERADGTIVWPPEDAFVMGVLGFREALASSNDILLPHGQRVAVVVLPMLAVLKVFAWSERRAREPRKDAPDLLFILRKYLDAGQGDRLYNEAPHLFNAGDFDYERAGAWLAGHDAAELIRRHSPDPGRIEERLQSILTPEIDPGGPLRLIGEVVDMDMSAERALKLLAAFLAGVNGEQRP
jgi:predicted nucleotidyltransferase